MAKKDLILIVGVDDKGTPVIKGMARQVGGELQKLDKKARTTGKGFNKLKDDVDKSASGMSKFKGMLKSTMVQMAAGMGIMMGVQGAVRAIKNAVTDFVKTGREFEKSWANVTTMLSISDKATLKMKNQLIGLSPTLGSVTKMAEGMYQVLSASIEPAKAIEFLGVAAKAAVAGVTDVFTSVDALTTVINAYGFAAEDATRISDIMFQTVKRGKLTFGELSSALGTVVPTAAQLGIRFEEIAAGMATLTRQGINVNTVTMQLRQVMMSVLKPTTEAKTLAKELGIEFTATALKAKGLSNFLAEITEKTQGNVTIMGEFFSNIRALSAVFGLAGKSAADFAYDISLMEDSMGSTEVAFQKQMKTLDFWIKTASHALEDMKVAFYEGLVDPIRSAISSQKDLDKVFESMTNSARLFGEAIGNLIKLLKPYQLIITQVLTIMASLDEMTALIIEGITVGLVPAFSDMKKEARLAAAEIDQLAEAERKLNPVFVGVYGAIAEGMVWWKRQVDYYIDSGMAIDEYLEKLLKLRKGTADFQVQSKLLQAVQDLGLKSASYLRNELIKLEKNLEEVAGSDYIYTRQLETHIKKAMQLAKITGQHLSPVVRQLAIDLGLLKTTAQLVEEIKIKITPPSDSIPDMVGYDEAIQKAKEADKANQDFAVALNAIANIAMGTGLSVEELNKGYEMNAKAAEKAAKAEKWAERMAKADKFAAKVQKVASLITTATAGMDTIFNQLHMNQMQRIDNEYQKRKQAIDDSMASDQEKYYQIEALDREMDKKRLAAKRKQAKATKVTSLMEAIVHTASAVAEALPNIPLSILVGILGAAQVALIAAQPLPTFAKGGIAGLHGPEIIMVGEEGPERITPIKDERPPMVIMPGLTAPAGSRSVLFEANYYITAMDALGVRDFIRDKAGPEMVEWIRLNKTEMLEALELE